VDRQLPVSVGNRFITADALGVDVIDDESGIVSDPVDQRRSPGVLILHTQEKEAWRLRQTSAVDRHTVVVEDWDEDP